jgi:hypothetical protein
MLLARSALSSPNHHRTTPELFKPKPPEGIEGPARMQEMGTYEYQI